MSVYQVLFTIAAWYNIVSALVHGILLTTTATSIVKHFNHQWYNHSKSLKCAMIFWFLQGITSILSIVSSNHFIPLNANQFKPVCDTTFKIHSVLNLSSVVVALFLCFVTLDETFTSSEFMYSPKFLNYLKVAIFGPLCVLGTISNSALGSKVIQLSGNPNTVMCGMDASSFGNAAIFVKLFSVWYLISHLTVLGLFLSKMIQLLRTKTLHKKMIKVRKQENNTTNGVSFVQRLNMTAQCNTQLNMIEHHIRRITQVMVKHSILVCSAVCITLSGLILNFVLFDLIARCHLYPSVLGMPFTSLCVYCMFPFNQKVEFCY